MADKSYVTITRDITRTLIPKGAIVRGTECDDGSWDVQVEAGTNSSTFRETRSTRVHPRLTAW